MNIVEKLEMKAMTFRSTVYIIKASLLKKHDKIATKSPQAQKQNKTKSRQKSKHNLKCTLVGVFLFFVCNKAFFYENQIFF